MGNLLVSAPVSRATLNGVAGALIEKANQFLLTNSFRNAWADFSTHRSGRSTHWVTAYVLANTGRTFARNIHEFLRMFCSRHGLLGYNDHVPPDSDSTALGFLAYVRFTSNHDPLLIEKVLTFLELHATSPPFVGLSTYHPNSQIKQYKDDTTDFSGWCGTAAPEVTAVALSALAHIPGSVRTRVLAQRWSRIFLHPDGIRAYWWTNDWYLYKWLSRAWRQWSLTENSLVSELTPIMRQIASAWLEHLPNSVDTPFEAACYLSTGSQLHLARVISASAYRAQVSGVAHLLLSQVSEGDGWRSNSILRIPHPSDMAPWSSRYLSRAKPGTGGLHGDNGVFTAATVCAAAESMRMCLLKEE